MTAVTSVGALSIALLCLGCSGSDESGPVAGGVTVDRSQNAAGAQGSASPRAGSAGAKSPVKSSGNAGAGGQPGTAANMTGSGSTAGQRASADAGGSAGSPAEPAAEGGASAAAGSGAGGSPGQAPAKVDMWNDPGSGPWQLVPSEKVVDECKLDPALLAKSDSMFPSGWAVVRYGKLCHEAGPSDSPTEVYSATKTLGALVTGIASYETIRIPRSGPRSGQLLDSDLASAWLANQSYNKDARVGHVLGMEAQNGDLAWGKKMFAFDSAGDVQINSLSEMINTAISQDAMRLSGGIAPFVKKFLFDAIGMSDSTWTGVNFGYSWSTTLHDMARLGVLMLHKGTWSGTRILEESWIYKMTHPSFEDANTGFGYLTWLNARVAAAGAVAPGSATAADTCAPAALWPRYPHPISDAPSCNYAGSPCDQEQDVGVWSAQGENGQYIIGHPGLDLVIVAKNYDGPMGAHSVWAAVRPALVAVDPSFKGDEAGFCAAYAGNRYAPDLAVPWQAPYGTGSMQP